MTGPSISVSTKVHLWWTWLRIAANHVGEAQRARSGEAEVYSFEAAESAALSREFEAAPVGIAAVAFSMEALCKDIEAAGLPGLKHPKHKNRGFKVGQHFVQAFLLKGEFAGLLPERLEHVFHLRNNSVHFESETREGVNPHPSGTQTAEELTVYTFEEALETLRLGREILDECLKSFEAGNHHIAAEAVSKEMPGVTKMFDEVLAREGLIVR